MKRALAVMLALLAPAIARADSEECANAYEHGQELRLAHKLASAREQFLICARPACPRAAREDCAKWLGEVDAALPVVIVHATMHGAPLYDARVVVDGAPVAERVDGRAITLDPGKHVVRIEPPHCLAREKEVTLASGPSQIDIDACAEVADATPKPSTVHVVRHPPLATFTFGGIAIAATVSFAVFGGVGAADATNLRSTCGTACNQGEVDSANTKLLVADISLGVAIASVAAGLVWWLVAPRIETRMTGVRRASIPLRWTF